VSDADQPGSGLERIWSLHRIATLYCFVAAAIVAGFAQYDLLPGHDLAQIVPLIVQLLLSGTALAAMAWLRRSHSFLSRSVSVRYATFLLEYGLGLIGLILAGETVFGLTSYNALALLLIVPGLAPFLPLFAVGGEERSPGAEVLAELPKVPSITIARLFLQTALSQGLLYAAFFGVLMLAFRWYAILKRVLWTTTRFDFSALAHSYVKQASDFWPVIVIYVCLCLFIGIVLAFAQWGPYVRQGLGRLWERLGATPLSEQQREFVQSKLQALWDYANAPEQEAKSIAAILVPVLPALAFAGLAFWLVVDSASWAERLFSAPPFPAGWQLLVRDGSWTVGPTILSCLVAWAVYRLSIDLWPRAFQDALVSDLRRSSTLEPSKIRALRNSITRDMRRGVVGADTTFDPRTYLAARRRRFSRRFYVVGLISFVAAVLIAWRGMASYSVVTEQGIDDIGFLTGAHYHYAFGDVATVRLQCFWSDKSTDLTYETVFRDGRSDKLLFLKDLPGSLVPLERIDLKLRSIGTHFEPVADNPRGLQNARNCAKMFGKKYGDVAGFAQIMQLD
jgi:hypothetical protein